MRQRRKNPTRFEQQSRRRQKNAYIDTKNRIRRDAPILGGKFTTHDYIHGQNGWLDALFLGSKAPRYYNLTIETTHHAYREAVSDRAWALSYELAREGPEYLFTHPSVRNPRTGLYEVAPHRPFHHPELGGMTRLEWVESQHRAITDSGELQVFEEWTLHRDYSRGIGLHATLDVPFLTIDVVNEFIDRFLAQEADYRSAVYRTWKYDQVPHWGLESNAVIDPLDWPQEQRNTLKGSLLRYDSPTDPVWPDHED